MSINIVRSNNFEYSFKLSTKEGIRHIAKALTFINPNPFAYNRKIEKFNRKKLTFKIGMLSTVEKYVEEHKISYKKTDYKYSLPESVEIDQRLSGNHDYQRQAVEQFYKRRFGIIVVPTRGGKTFIAAEILRIFLQTDTGNFLFIVDNVTLFNQVINDFQKYFEPYGGIDIGEIRAGNIDTEKRVTVGMIQTIQSVFSNRNKDLKRKRNLERYFKNLKFLCVDEIHENCSNSKLRIYKKAKNLEYQLCLSATPYRAETLVQNLKLQEWSGDVIYTISQQELREKHVLSDYRVFMLLIDHTQQELDKDINDYTDYRRELILKNETRDKILIEVINFLREMKLKTLVLFQSVEHGRAMSSALNITFISGETKGEEREEEKVEFLKKDGGILLASNIFKKGITLPEAEVMINVDGGLERANVIQRAGRVLGVTETKQKSLIIDFIDLFDVYFSKHSEARLDTYVKEIGEDKIGILDTSVNSWIETFKDWTKKWFEINEE